MLIFSDKNLVFLAVPKTGTTAVEMALRPRADIIFGKGRKHIPAQRYRNKVAPFLKNTFGVQLQTVAVMREPVDQIRSWYRYRSSGRIDAANNTPEGMDFDTFVAETMTPKPLQYAAIGSQFSFLCNAEGALLVDHLFAYERHDAFLDFMSVRLGIPITLKQKNVSPAVEAVISDAMLLRLHEARKGEFSLYNKLMQNDGYLKGNLS